MAYICGDCKQEHQVPMSNTFLLCVDALSHRLESVTEDRDYWRGKAEDVLQKAIAENDARRVANLQVDALRKVVSVASQSWARNRNDSACDPDLAAAVEEYERGTEKKEGV